MAKILVVDDSKMMRELIGATLEEAGYEVTGVDPHSLVEVLNQLNALQPDLVLTDYQMPHFNGEALVRAIQADSNHSELPIMVLSAHRDEDIILRMSRLGVSGYLFKGKGMQELLAKVAEVLPPDPAKPDSPGSDGALPAEQSPRIP